MQKSISQEMIQAGVSVLERNYLSLEHASEYPEIVRTVFAKMEAAQRASENVDQQNHK